MAPADLRALSSHERGNEAFVKNFYIKSRLHWIGTWNDRFEKYLADREELRGPLPQLRLFPSTSRRRVVFHVDMDAFFATASSLGKPHLQGKPVAVSWGSSSQGRSEISSANYVARSFGVKAGMWMKRAKELCPHLVVVQYDFEKYTKIATKVYDVLFDISPHVRGLSCDEAYIDVTHLMPAGEGGVKTAALKLAENVRAKIFDASGGCTASVGAGHSELVARIATKHAKPNKAVFVSMSEQGDFLRLLGVAEFPGVGRKTSKALLERGIRTGADILATPLRTLQRVIGKAAGKQLHEFASGKDNRKWDPRPVRKSLSAQTSWGVRTASNAEACDMLKRLAAQVSKRLKRTGYEKGGKRVGLKVWKTTMDEAASRESTWIGHGPCDVLTRMYALSRPTGKAAEIFQAAKSLLLEMRIPPAEIRGLGVVVGRLERSPLVHRASAASIFGGSASAGAARKRKSLPSSSSSSTSKKIRSHDCTSFLPRLLAIKKQMGKMLEAAAANGSERATETMFQGLLPNLSSVFEASKKEACCAGEGGTCVVRWARLQADNWGRDEPDNALASFWVRARSDWLAVVDEALKA